MIQIGKVGFSGTGYYSSQVHVFGLIADGKR
jgi:hypothetical protein